MKKYLFPFFFLSLVGCGSLTSEKVPCPKTAILAEFSKAIDFQKEVPIRTEMDSLFPRCTVNGTIIYMDLRLRVTSLRPLPSFLAPMKIKSSYFVAVVDGAGNVLSRTNHDLDVEFEEKQTTKVTFLRLQEKVPSEKELAVYVGFNLDETQFDFLQKEREGKAQGTVILKKGRKSNKIQLKLNQSSPETGQHDLKDIPKTN